MPYFYYNPKHGELQAWFTSLIQELKDKSDYYAAVDLTDEPGWLEDLDSPEWVHDHGLDNYRDDHERLVELVQNGFEMGLFVGAKQAFALHDDLVAPEYTVFMIAHNEDALKKRLRKMADEWIEENPKEEEDDTAA